MLSVNKSASGDLRTRVKKGDRILKIDAQHVYEQHYTDIIDKLKNATYPLAITFERLEIPDKVCSCLKQKPSICVSNTYRHLFCF